MQLIEPKDRDIAFDDEEEQEVIQQVEKWKDELQQDFEKRTPCSITFTSLHDKPTTEALAMRYLDRMIFTYAAPQGCAARLKPSFGGNKIDHKADFIWPVPGPQTDQP